MNFYSSKFFYCLTDQFWDQSRMFILKRVFSYQTIFIGAYFFCMFYDLKTESKAREPEWNNEKYYVRISGVVTIITFMILSYDSIRMLKGYIKNKEKSLMGREIAFFQNDILAFFITLRALFE
mmetsp:Transcript_8235/g.11404  ORF Transcript_8235/g.11404 Transcript_8235/m.11404 type:complete len:123 (+) Transcript_8235:804-1172(+)|eukprot:CAMPEP_0185590538 /NCGR_PEP_ID=MMETSP0434-20130131/61093_1 /TAXON_ID=626734 ORGANISM="Favella taraikaensis, Strain Fe Narragansett Bay" /NCGR_SAMPLE_ID=MMETSP0434 /ASSEMBLY_ACC=CAM_ASM_000379 /LENGTH=122 /DNA_ID=CAMNT_0028214803 /DNA_START=759 /DNA_END=1127 /DNA_ORIENTATION=-